MGPGYRSSSPLLGLCLLGAIGCGVSPGDYIVYRVNVGAQSLSTGCFYPEEEPPDELSEDSDSFRAPQTWVVFYAAGDEIVLDAEGFSMRGEGTDDGFEFVADQIDVTYAGIDQQEARVSELTRITVTMNTDGDAVAGDIVALTRTTCDFLTAAPSPGVCEDIPDCTQTSPFSGVKLDDVELEEGVDRPNDEIGNVFPPGPGPGPGPEPEPEPGS